MHEQTMHLYWIITNSLIYI